MSKFCSFLLIFLFSIQSMAFSMAYEMGCQAFFVSEVDEQMVTKKLDLKKTFEDTRTIRWEVDFEGANYFVQGDKKTAKYRLAINMAPDYNQGVISTLVWDHKSEMKISRIDVDGVHRLHCSK